MNDQTSNPALAFTRTQLESNLHWVSILLRLTIGSLFLGAALVKTPMGISGVVAYYSSLLHDSLLPGFLVRTHATVILFLEYGMALWLFSGFRLRLAWIAASFVLISLAVGMIFAGKYDVAANNYFYVFLGALGLLSSPFDRWVLPRTSNSAPRPS
ncbi:MAG: hypothetical protein H0X34_14110 [Chthoniobacterales bacterium]|nr:hypothetical protein [Chthoniobacterales bacterium]